MYTLDLFYSTSSDRLYDQEFVYTPPPSNQIVFDFISISFGTNLKGVVQPKGKYFYNLLVFILFQILETFIYLFKKNVSIH